MTRDEIIALIVSKAQEYGIEPWELLGGAIAESNLDPNAYRDGPWPDKSPGLFQQTIKFADEGDHTDSPENIAEIKQLYCDPVHATDVAAKKFLYWRHNPDVPPLTAWVAYNSPGFYHTPEESPNVENYRRGLAEAQTLLGASPMPASPAALTYNPDTPPQRQVQSWTCSIRATAWVLAALGVPVEIGALQDEMSPTYVTPADGLLDGRGYGIAEILKAHLPADWADRVHVFETITWDELRSLAGSGPVALGLHGAYHWINVARARVDGDLDAPNPAPNYPATGPIGDVLSRAEFDQYGPAAAVWVNAASAATPAPLPVPVQTDEVARLRAELADKTARLDAEISTLGYISGDVAAACDRVAEAATAIASTLRSMRPPAA